MFLNESPPEAAMQWVQLHYPILLNETDTVAADAFVDLLLFTFASEDPSRDPAIHLPGFLAYALSEFGGSPVRHYHQSR
jgi:hypothetical protein